MDLAHKFPGKLLSSRLESEVLKGVSRVQCLKGNKPVGEPGVGGEGGLPDGAVGGLPAGIVGVPPSHTPFTQVAPLAWQSLTMEGYSQAGYAWLSSMIRVQVPGLW